MEQRDPREDEALFKQNVLAAGKSAYVMGKSKPAVECILCAVRDDNPSVVSKKLFQDEQAFITLNLYPYNPGHLLIVPTRHVERFRDLTDQERQAIVGLIAKAQDALQSQLGCIGFNTGINEGPGSGASIAHLHVHLVPRFNNELGFIDIIGKTRAMVYSADEIVEKLKGKITS